MAVTGLTSGVTGIAAGGSHTCAVVSAAAKCWGSNTASQLGNNSATNSKVPVAVTGLTSGVSQVAAGLSTSFAITTAGAVQGWGGNGSGQIAENPATKWTRYITAIDGDMAATLTSAGKYRYAISNIRGDVVADADANGLSQSVAIDEFGNPATNLPGDRRYGFMGSKQREALTPSGTVAMGVRLYVPGSGRFLQPDPVLGGNANPYDYCNGDPINCADLNGEFSLKKALKKLKNGIKRQIKSLGSYLPRNVWKSLRKAVKLLWKPVTGMMVVAGTIKCLKEPTQDGPRTGVFTQYDKDGNANTVVLQTYSKNWSESFSCVWQGTKDLAT